MELFYTIMGMAFACFIISVALWPIAVLAEYGLHRYVQYATRYHVTFMSPIRKAWRRIMSFERRFNDSSYVYKHDLEGAVVSVYLILYLATAASAIGYNATFATDVWTSIAVGPYYYASKVGSAIAPLVALAIVMLTLTSGTRAIFKFKEDIEKRLDDK